MIRHILCNVPRTLLEYRSGCFLALPECGDVYYTLYPTNFPTSKSHKEKCALQTTANYDVNANIPQCSEHAHAVWAAAVSCWKAPCSLSSSVSLEKIERLLFMRLAALSILSLRDTSSTTACTYRTPNTNFLVINRTVVVSLGFSAFQYRFT